MTLDQTVDLRGTVGGSSEENFSETTHIFLDGMMLAPESAPDLLGSLPAHVRLKQHLQNKFARFSAGAHGSCQAISFSFQSTGDEKCLSGRVFSDEHDACVFGSCGTLKAES